MSDLLLKIEFDYIDGIQNTFLNGENVENEIRGENISILVSKYSSIPLVRKYLVSLQKELGKEKKIVVEGRDITTVVFPDAEIKIFMTADIETRAKRRFEEIKTNNPETTFSDVLNNLKEAPYPYQSNPLKLVEVWGQYYKKGAYQISHYHSHSDWAFVYYVNTPEGSSPLVFDKSDRMVYSKAGELVIFPGWLIHHVPENEGEGRSVISGNLSYE